MPTKKQEELAYKVFEEVKGFMEKRQISNKHLVDNELMLVYPGIEVIVPGVYSRNRVSDGVPVLRTGYAKRLYHGATLSGEGFEKPTLGIEDPIFELAPEGLLKEVAMASETMDIMRALSPMCVAGTVQNQVAHKYGFKTPVAVVFSTMMAREGAGKKGSSVVVDSVVVTIHQANSDVLTCAFDLLKVGMDGNVTVYEPRAQEPVFFPS